MAWTWDDINGWLQQIGVDAHLINRGPFIPEMPAQLITFTFSGGAGLLSEGELDDQNFQVRVRGDASDQNWPEAMAWAVDALIRGASFPVLIGSTKIRMVDRAGSPPTPLGAPDDGDRFEYICNYRMVVGL
jgi:hypothetical protein